MCIGAENAALATTRWTRRGVGIKGVREAERSAWEWDIGKVVIRVKDEAHIIGGVGEGVEEKTTIWAVRPRTGPDGRNILQPLSHAKTLTMDNIIFNIY